MPDDSRNECYPALPAVPFRPLKRICAKRRAVVDERNARISQGGAQLAVEACDKSIGGGVPSKGKGK